MTHRVLSTWIRFELAISSKPRPSFWVWKVSGSGARQALGAADARDRGAVQAEVLVVSHEDESAIEPDKNND